MPTITKYCNTYSQTADSNNAKFNNLVTLKSASGYAETNTISKKGGTHPKPSTVTCTNFNFNLPTGAEVTEIKVEYEHRKLAITKDKYPNLPAPTIDLVGASAKAQTGVAPLGVTKKHTVKWTGNWSRAVVSSAGFGVKISYKSNTSKDYTGKLRLSLLRITITYKTPSYSVNVSVGGDKTAGKKGTLTVSLGNKNKTSYNPSVTINLPSQITYDGAAGGDGSITKISETQLRWNAGITSKTGTASITLNITFNAATIDSTVSVKAIETLNGTNKTATFSIAAAVITDNETDTSKTINDGATIGSQTVQQLKSYYITDETEIIYTFNIPQTNNECVLRTINAENVFSEEEVQQINDMGIFMRELSAGDWAITIPEDIGATVSSFQLTMNFENHNHNDIIIREYNTGGQEYAIISFLSSNEVSLSMIKLTQEELDRLGDGYTYTVQAYAKASLTESRPYYILREGKHSFRLGVYNGDLSSSEYPEWDMVTNCENWSNPIETRDTYYDLKTEFTYNSSYPVYIFITGEYLELNEEIWEVSFTQPAVIDSDYYDSNGRVMQNVLPYPLTHTIEDGESSSFEIQAFHESNPLIIYDFDLPADFSTNNDIAVRGIQLSADIVADDELIIDATLRLEGGKTGQRSLVLNPLDTMSEEGQITLGGSTDLWGLSVGDMQNLDKAEIEIRFNNLFSNENNSVKIQLSNINVTVYYLDITQLNQVAPCRINDEEIAWYGAYLKSLADVHGLKTETSYITVKGTDLNEPYVQTIQEKEIEIDFGIDADTVEESAELMKSFARHVVNERDKYNKPILNKIEFPTVYPDEHWDFILDGGLTNTVSFKEYEGTLKMIIPSGTSFSNEDTVAGTHGYNGGIANVNPIITAIPLAETVEITESVHNQSFRVNYPFPENSLIEINCNDRTVTLKTLNTENDDGTDITAYVDYNSDWFILYMGEFNFSSTTATIRTVQYNERG